jgi:hypothetical protein
LIDYYEEVEVRGEVTLVLDAPTGRKPPAPDPVALSARAGALVRAGNSVREVSGILRKEFGISRNEAYAAALAAGEGEGGGR